MVPWRTNARSRLNKDRYWRAHDSLLPAARTQSFHPFWTFQMHDVKPIAREGEVVAINLGTTNASFAPGLTSASKHSSVTQRREFMMTTEIQAEPPNTRWGAKLSGGTWQTIGYFCNRKASLPRQQICIYAGLVVLWKSMTSERNLRCGMSLLAMT